MITTKMDFFLRIKIMELCNDAKHSFGGYWEAWRRPVNDLVVLTDAMKINSLELKQARDKAIEAIEHLKDVTHATVEEIEKRNKPRTSLEPQVPLHVNDKPTGVEARQPPDGLDVVHDEVELLARVCQ